MELRTNPEYEALLPVLSDEEYESLKYSLLTEGQHYPIIINQYDIILDGHQRYKACQEIGIECDYIVKEFDDPLLEKKFVIEVNLKRRQLTDFQKFELDEVLIEIDEELAQQRMTSQPRSEETGQFEPLGSPDPIGRSVEKSAKRTGLSPTTIKRSKKIKEKGTEKEIESVRKAEAGIRTVYEKIQKREAKKRLAENPPEESDELTLFKHLDYAPKPWDVWNYRRDDVYGLEYPGSIPAGIVFNTLYFYTEEGDLVVDPMAGGGVVGDVCKAVNREYMMFDINPGRDDIVQHDLNDGFPVADADLVFLDPPYYKKMEKEYGEESISSLDRESYLDFFSHLSINLYDSGTRKVAFLMSDYTDDEDPSQHIFIWEYVKRFEEAGWIPIRHIMCPISTTAIHPDFVVKFRKSKKLGRLGRSLVIFEREIDNE